MSYLYFHTYNLLDHFCQIANSVSETTILKAIITQLLNKCCHWTFLVHKLFFVYLLFSCSASGITCLLLCIFSVSQLNNEQGKPTWKPVFIALTDKDLLMYDTAPWSKEEWATPFQSHPLLATRYSDCNSSMVEVQYAKKFQYIHKACYRGRLGIPCN